MRKLLLLTILFLLFTTEMLQAQGMQGEGSVVVGIEARYGFRATTGRDSSLPLYWARRDGTTLLSTSGSGGNSFTVGGEIYRQLISNNLGGGSYWALFVPAGIPNSGSLVLSSPIEAPETFYGILEYVHLYTQDGVSAYKVTHISRTFER